MGSIINPLGGRLGSKLMWRGSYPVVYQTSRQFAYFELLMNIRLLFNILLVRVFKLQPSVKVEDHFHGMLLQVLTNVWGGQSDRCSVFVRIFDYKIVTMLLELKTRDVFSNQLGRMLSWLVTYQKPEMLESPYSLTERGGLPVMLTEGEELHVQVQSFIQRYFAEVLAFLSHRVDLWHYSVVAFTRPYFRWLMRKYQLTKFVCYTTIEHSSLTAAMLVKYMVLKLNQGFDLTVAIKNLRNGIHEASSVSTDKEGGGVVGYKLCCSGRFTRKQIATYRWIRNGYLCLNQVSGALDYAQIQGYSKFGAYGIKLWLFYG